MVTLLEFEQAKSHLRVRHSFEDELIEGLCVQATGIVLDYLEATDNVELSPAVWEITTVPEPVKAAIKEVLANLYRHRGDEGEMAGPITPRVENVLRRYRRPALA